MTRLRFDYAVSEEPGNDGATLTVRGERAEVSALWSALGILLATGRESAFLNDGTVPPGAATTKVLTRDDLQQYAEGEEIEAGGFDDHRRHQRVRWVRLHDGRWQPTGNTTLAIDGRPGVSSLWLASNRQPTALPGEVAP